MHVSMSHTHIQMLLSHVEPLTEQQIVGVYGLQQSALETEEALSQGLEALYQSLLQAMRSEKRDIIKGVLYFDLRKI